MGEFREAGKRGLVVALLLLFAVLVVLDLTGPDSLLRAILDAGGPREALHRFLHSVREGEVWPGAR